MYRSTLLAVAVAGLTLGAGAPAGAQPAGAAAPRATLTAQAATPAIGIAQRLARPHSPVIGPRAAPVTIVEFFDPSCEACRAFYPAVKQIMARYPRDVRVVVRYLPFHPGSAEAVHILEAARAQNVYLPVLEAVLDAQPQWHDGDMASAWSAAAGAGLDVARARATTASPRLTTMLRQDVADARAVGVKGTPTFFVNGRRLTVLDPQQLSAMVGAAAEGRRR